MNYYEAKQNTQEVKAKKIAAYDKITSLLNDDLYSDSKDYQPGDIVERVEWLLSMYEGIKQSEKMAWEKLAEANDIICEMNVMIGKEL